MKNNMNVTLCCKDCGSSFELQYGWVKKFPPDHHWRCKKCRVDNHRNWYKNMDSEQRLLVHNRMSNSAKNRWSNMDKDEYDKICQSMSDGDREYWDRLSVDEYKKRCSVNQSIWDNMSEEKRKQRAEKISRMLVDYWENMSDDRYRLMCEILSNAAKSFWDSISDEDLAKRRLATSERSKEYWKNMTQEEYARWKRKQSEGFNSYLDNLQKAPNRNESSLIGYLNIFGISWSYQYSNREIHPDFVDLFPINPIFQTTHVNPFHSWDFKLDFTNHESILVDIDGSIHDPDRTNYTVTYFTGEKFVLSDYVRFNDSQRPYQRDDMDAYVVQCHDDNLTTDSIVIDVMSGNSMSLRKFLHLLSAYNMKPEH